MENSKIEKQITSISGEFYVAAELAKRNFQVSLTLGNAKAVDIFANKAGSNKVLKIEVKTLRKSPNCFTLNPDRISDTTFFVFVYLNELETDPTFYIVRGKELLSNLAYYYGASLVKDRKTVNHGPLQKHKGKWDIIK